jgi:hypothetical protein
MPPQLKTKQLSDGCHLLFQPKFFKNFYSNFCWKKQMAMKF